MPIFVGGMFKSGTSLTRKYLGNHPNIFAGLETNWFQLDDYFKKEISNISDVVSMWNSFYSIDESDIYKIIDFSNSSEEVLDKMMFHIKSKHNFIDWCDKSPPNISYGERIIDYWKDSKIIHVIRDPLDIFGSLKQAKKWNSPKEFVERWSLIFSKVEYLRKKKNYIEIYYEDLILNTEITLKKIYEFCNLGWKNDYAKHEPDKWEYKIVKKMTGKDSTTLKRLSKPITKNRIGIGEKILNQNEIEEITFLIKEKNLLDEFMSALRN